MLVESICGDYFTVVGLPVCKVYEALRAFGIDALKG
jgi:predicted house-cleaning NTP pyrophosphatase (Maf/HAM1 superfamily)